MCSLRRPVALLVSEKCYKCYICRPVSRLCSTRPAERWRRQVSGPWQRLTGGMISVNDRNIRELSPQPATFGRVRTGFFLSCGCTSNPLAVLPTPPHVGSGLSGVKAARTECRRQTQGLRVTRRGFNSGCRLLTARRCHAPQVQTRHRRHAGAAWRLTAASSGTVASPSATSRALTDCRA